MGGRPKPGITEAIMLGAAVKRRRLALGLTLADLEGSAGVTLSSLSKLERGQLNPGVFIVHRIAKALGTTVTDLLEPT